MPEKTARGGINACEPPFIDELKRLGMDVREEIYSFNNDEKTSVFKRAKQVVKIASRFRKILREGAFDVLHINTDFTLNPLLRDSFTLFFIGKTRTKIFLKFHGSNAGLAKNKNFLTRFLIRFVVKKVGGIGILSSEEKRNFVNAGFDENKFFVVKNALLGLPEDKPVRDFSVSKERPLSLLFVSRLIPAKGLIETIQAVKILHEKGLSINLEVLGDGPTLPVAKDLVETLEITEIINFHGHQPEKTVQEFYLKCDLLVFPTYHNEGFPMVLFNALGFGLPVITTKIRAAADYLQEPENCLFCEPRDAVNVAEKIVELLQNNSLRRQMSENNFNLASEFTAEKIAPEYLEIYKRIGRQNP